jgi:hypothetical protein
VQQVTAWDVLPYADLIMSDFLKPNIKSVAPKWMVQAVKFLALYLRVSWFESLPGLPVVLTEIAFFLIYSGVNLGRGIGSFEM